MRARELFAVMLETIVSAATLARRAFLSRATRRDLLARLKPVEKIARLLLITRAATYLLMTPNGMRLRQTAKPAALPKHLTSAPARRTRIWLGATLACCQPRPAPMPIANPAPPAAADKTDPSHWACRFHVLRWRTPMREPKPPRARIWSMSLEDDLPTGPPQPAAPAAVHAGERDDAATPLALARRIEALARVLANPEPTIRRLARRLASLPAERLEWPTLVGARVDRWWHGAPEAFNARNHAWSAWGAWTRAHPRRIEPG
jgi:hypothetical protein